MNRYLLTGLLIFLPFQLFGDVSSHSLYFRSSNVTLNYLTTYHAQTTDVLNISQASGEDQMLKNTSYEYVEAQKDLNRTSPGEVASEEEPDGFSQANTLEAGVKVYFIKKVEKNRAAKSIKPLEMTFRHSAIGRLIYPFNMKDLVCFGMPLFFPRQPVKEGETWEKKFDFTDFELPVLTMNQEITFKRLITLHTRKLAELEYSFRGGLHTTQMTNDPEIVGKIEEMKKNDIESVSFEGNGKATFDVERGAIVTHELAMSRRIRKTVIRGDERVIQDLLTTYEFTEALTN